MTKESEERRGLLEDESSALDAQITYPNWITKVPSNLSGPSLNKTTGVGQTVNIYTFQPKGHEFGTSYRQSNCTLSSPCWSEQPSWKTTNFVVPLVNELKDKKHHQHSRSRKLCQLERNQLHRLIQHGKFEKKWRYRAVLPYSTGADEDWPLSPNPAWSMAVQLCGPMHASPGFYS